MSSLSHQQVSSVCNIKSVQENKAATEHPTLRPDYETIVQQWDEHPAFRENSYSMLLEVQTFFSVSCVDGSIQRATESDHLPDSIND